MSGWGGMAALTSVAALALTRWLRGPVIGGVCPAVFDSRLEAGIEPLAVEVVGGEVHFEFADAQARSDVAYEVWLHAVPAGCVATGAPIGGRRAAGAPDERRVVAACTALVTWELLVAS